MFLVGLSTLFDSSALWSKNMQNKYHKMMTLGVIGRCNIDDLSQIKKQIEEIPGFRVVFFKTASGRLWVRIEERL